jgi:hypothetical protein
MLYLSPFDRCQSDCNHTQYITYCGMKLWMHPCGSSCFACHRLWSLDSGSIIHIYSWPFSSKAACYVCPCNVLLGCFRILVNFLGYTTTVSSAAYSQWNSVYGDSDVSCLVFTFSWHLATFHPAQLLCHFQFNLFGGSTSVGLGAEYILCNLLHWPDYS